MIRVENVHKTYPSQHGERVVLQDVNLTVPPGFRLAVLGRNGAGKSTLIRLISKIEQPTRGTVTHSMSVSWPLGFSGTFQGSLTGIDNIKFIARIYRADYAQLRAAVETFSELGRLLYEPVKTYSAGMKARLAFALSVAIDFDCYLIDEIIMVGDERFQARCREQLFDRSNGRAMVLASHNASFVEDLCDGALVISRGRTCFYDDISYAVKIYKSL